MRKQHCKNGFSIAEVVIALAIISVVSITALSIALSSIVTKTNIINRSEAQSFAGNVLECFKAAENEAEFLALVSFAEDVSLTDGAPDGSGSTTYTYYCEDNKFTAQITVNYPESLRSELAITITNPKGVNIISFSYRKGDGI